LEAELAGGFGEAAPAAGHLGSEFIVFVLFLLFEFLVAVVVELAFDLALEVVDVDGLDGVHLFAGFEGFGVEVFMDGV
jgi:hypothetical protein